MIRGHLVISALYLDLHLQQKIRTRFPSNAAEKELNTVALIQLRIAVSKGQLAISNPTPPSPLLYVV